MMKGVCTVAQWALNAAMTANPIGIIIVAIGALIAIGIAMWMSQDSICEWCKNAFQSVGTFFVSVGNSTGTFFAGLWNGITSFFKGVWNAILSDAISIFTAMGNIIKNVWTGIVGAVKGIINGVISAVNSMIRGAVSGVNGLVKGINQVTNAVGVPSIPTFSTPQIPMLAKGCMIRTVGSVIVGEKGAKLLTLTRGAQVTPLARTTATKNTNHFDIRIYADGKSVHEIIDELIPKLKLALVNL